jgi:hypothetical protein
MMRPNKPRELTSRDDATGEARALDTRLAAQCQRRWAGSHLVLGHSGGGCDAVSLVALPARVAPEETETLSCFSTCSADSSSQFDHEPVKSSRHLPRGGRFFSSLLASYSWADPKLMITHITIRIAALKYNLILATISTTSIVSAQRAERSILSNEEAWPVGVETVASWGLHDDGKLSVVRLSSMTAAEVNSGVDLPGGMFVVSETEILICGRNALGVGLLEHWRLNVNVGSLQLQSSFSSPIMDFGGVVYDAASSKIYLLDCTGARIVHAAWGSALPLESLALSTLVDAASLPFLGESQSLVLVPNRRVDGGSMNLVRWPMRRGVAFAEIVDATPPIVRHGIGGWLAPSVSLNDLTVTEGSSTVEVCAPSGTVVEVAEVGSSTILGSGVVGAAGVLSVALAQPLAIGARYAAQAVGVARQTSSACVFRYGFPESFSSGAAIDRFYYQSGAEIGQPFTVEVGVSAGMQGGMAVYDGYLLIGLRIGGVNPVLPYGSNWLLSTSAYVPAQGFMTSSGWGMISGDITIPNDPGLVGLVFLNQFVMEDGQNFVLSEVYGAVIEATPSAAASLQASTASNPLAPAVAVEHIEFGLLSGGVLDATPKLLQILMRR